MSLLVALYVSATGIALAQAIPDGEAKLEGEGAVNSALEAQEAAHPDDDHQHGGNEGHLPAKRQNVKVIGKAEAKGVVEGRIADVNYFGNYAYLAAFNEPECQDGGVYVFDIKNLTEPRQVGFIPAAEGSFVGEGVQVVEIDTPVSRAMS